MIFQPLLNYDLKKVFETGKGLKFYAHSAVGLDSLDNQHYEKLDQKFFTLSLVLRLVATLSYAQNCHRRCK